MSDKDARNPLSEAWSIEASWADYLALCKQHWPAAQHDKTAIAVLATSVNRVFAIDIFDTADADGNDDDDEPQPRHYILRYPLKLDAFKRRDLDHGVVLRRHVRILQWLNRYVPEAKAPKLVAHDDTADNPIRTPYMIQERLPGVPLNKVLLTMTEAQRLDVAAALGQWHTDMRDVTMPRPGHVVAAGEFPELDNTDGLIALQPFGMSAVAGALEPDDDAVDKGVELLTPELLTAVATAEIENNTVAASGAFDTAAEDTHASVGTLLHKEIPTEAGAARGPPIMEGAGLLTPDLLTTVATAEFKNTTVEDIHASVGNLPAKEIPTEAGAARAPSITEGAEPPTAELPPAAAAPPIIEPANLSNAEVLDYAFQRRLMSALHRRDPKGMDSTRLAHCRAILAKMGRQGDFQKFPDLDGRGGGPIHSDSDDEDDEDEESEDSEDNDNDSNEDAGRGSFCLWHTDPFPRNIIVDLTKQGHDILSGVVDWDAPLFGPGFVACMPPSWLWAPLWYTHGVGDFIGTFGLDYVKPESKHLHQVRDVFHSKCDWFYLNNAYNRNMAFARIFVDYIQALDWRNHPLFEKREEFIMTWIQEDLERNRHRMLE